MAYNYLKKIAYFNPRPPRGGRHRRAGSVRGMAVFQSTPSARRATEFPVHNANREIISIHALREEGDMLVSCLLPAGVVFQSTPSARRATDFAVVSWL